jgi:nitrate reductase NapAB chaperone NapD
MGENVVSINNRLASAVFHFKPKVINHTQTTLLRFPYCSVGKQATVEHRIRSRTW